MSESREIPYTFETADTERGLTPEIDITLDAKREFLRNGKKLGFRFVNSKEYFDTMRNGATPWNLEVNEGSLNELVTLGSYRPLDAARRKREIGGHGIPWYELAEDHTQWELAAGALVRTERPIERYKEIYRLAREAGSSIEHARAKFVEAAKSEAEVYIQMIYEDYKNNKGAEEHLTFSTPLMTDEHREKLLEIIKKSSESISDSDLRFLLRFYKPGARVNFRPRRDERHSGESAVPYEMVEIWDEDAVKSGINRWESTMGFKSVEAGTDIAHLLAVIALMPADKDFAAEIAQEGLKAAQAKPERAHLVLNPYLVELFPQLGQDHYPKKPTG